MESWRGMHNQILLSKNTPMAKNGKENLPLSLGYCLNFPIGLGVNPLESNTLVKIT